MLACRRFSRRLTTLGTAAAVLASGLATAELVAPSVSAEVPMAAASGIEDVQSRPDAASAVIAARSVKHRVEVTGARSETSTVWANPDGSVTAEESTGPIRVRAGDGGWTPVDLSLAATKAGDYAPKASAARVLFGGGASTRAGTITLTGGEQLGLEWPGKLPTPAVSGGVATYEVAPTANLVLSTTSAGFNARIVLSAPPSSAPTFRLPLALAKLSLAKEPDGRVTLSDRTGKAVGRIGQLMMWDAARDEAGDPVEKRPVSFTLGKTADGKPTLDLAPVMSFLTDPATRYPVTIDPDIASLTRHGDTYWYTNNTTPQASDYRLLVGTFNSGSTVFRSFVNFDPATLAGKHVTAATLKLFQYDAGSCSPQTMNVYSTTADVPGSTVWSNQPGITTAYGASGAFNTGNNTCSPAQPNAYQSVNVTGLLNAYASGALAWHGWELKAASETSNAYSKRFCSMNADTSLTYCNSASFYPTLSVTYNSYPTAPASLSDSPTVLGTTGVRYVTSFTPTLKAAVSDADGGNVRLDFELSHDPAYPSEGTGIVWTGSANGVQAGTVGSVTVPSGAMGGGNWQWRVRGHDGTDYGAWSSYRKLRTNLAAPAAPSISCASYPEGAWTARATSAVSCTADTTSLDGSGYLWALDDPNPATLVPDPDGSGGDPLSFSINPAPGWHILYAKARDSALHTSTATAYSFGANPGNVATPVDGAHTRRR